MKARRRKDSGFALLLVFLMAAGIAVALYMEIPRVAMESQRHKEQLLMERGLQYKRAIQLFVRGNGKRYPTKIEDLESFNNHRYLRHRYKDPITGKDEWRLVHVGGNGMLTDSLLNKKKPGDKDQQASSNTFITELAGLGTTGAGGTQPVAPGWSRRRQSEGGTGPVGPDGQPVQPLPGGGSLPGVPPAPPGSAPTPDPSITGAAPTGLPPGVPGMPPGMPPGMTPGAPPGAPTGVDPSQTPGAPGQPPGSVPQVPGMPGAPVNSQGTPYGTTPGSSGPGGNTTALNMINQILMNPNPRGAPPGSPIGQQIGGGIAGVASTSEDAAIMVYNDRTNYNEWEFVYDWAKERAPQNPNAGFIGKPVTSIQSTMQGSATTSTNSQGTTQLQTGGPGGPGTTPGPGVPGGAAGGAGGLPPDVRPGQP